MRRTLLSVAIAVAGAAGVTASGWAIQAAALPPPKPAARVAADASVWLHEYRFVVDVFHFDHRRMTGACLRGWFARPHGRKVRESLLSLEAGPVLRASTQGRVIRTGGHPDLLVPDHAAVAAGCTGKLDSALAAALQNGAHLTAARAFAANRPTIALRWSRGRDAHVTLYVSARDDYRPLVAIVEVAGRDATARLYLARARPRVLRRFRIRLPEPRR